MRTHARRSKVGCAAQKDVKPLRYAVVKGPLGPVYLAATGRGVCEISFRVTGEGAYREKLERLFQRPAVRDDRGLRPLASEIARYFARRKERFDYPIDLSAVKGFQREVLQAARRVPFGKVATYGELAERIGRPRASRAVGNALGRNPIPILVPCHRIVGCGGRLGGYSGGLDIKEILLRTEGIDPDRLRARVRH